MNMNEEVKSIVKQVMGQWNPRKITLEKALIIMKAVEEKAKQMGVKAVVAVSNEGARPVAIHCMDDAYIASYDIALQKSYTSVALKMSTSKLKELAKPFAPLYGVQHTNEGKIVIFGGGEPLEYEGKIIGGLGVSGGSEEQDCLLAEFGRKFFEEVMVWK